MKVLRIFQSVLYFVFDLQPVRGNVATPNMHLALVMDCISCQSPNFEWPAGGHTTTLALVIRLSSFMFVGPFNPFLPTPVLDGVQGGLGINIFVFCRVCLIGSSVAP